MTCLNRIISLKTQHASKTQAPHALITSILTKRQSFLIYLLSRLAFLATHNSLICTMLHSTFCKGPAKFIYYRSYNNYNEEELENVLKQKLVSSSNFEEFFDFSGYSK